MTKPKYNIPSMLEIKNLKHNGFNVISTFSGGGGSCLGYRMAGYKVLWASEFIEAAQEVYRANHPTSILDTRDIRKVSAEEILQATGLKKGELDLFDGSPPCAAFSTSGKREAGWGTIKKYSDKSQRVDDLFFEYTRLLKDLQPKVFVAENVSGLVKGTAKGYFKEIIRELKSCGYQVKAKLLNAYYLGVPQSRERLIFIGVRNDLNMQPVFPTPSPKKFTVGDALEGLVPRDTDAWILPKGKMRELYQLSINYKGYFSSAHKAKYGKESSFNHRRLLWDAPSPTIVQSSQSLYHPNQQRSLNISEIKRISGFPDDFVLTGSFAKKWERVGRAVPPLMMREIAKTVEREILCKITV